MGHGKPANRFVAQSSSYHLLFGVGYLVKTRRMMSAHYHESAWSVDYKEDLEFAKV